MDLLYLKLKDTIENQKTEAKLTTQVNEYSSRYQYLFLSLQSKAINIDNGLKCG